MTAQRSSASISPKAIRDYYATLRRYEKEGVKHEGALRSAFQDLLTTTARTHKWVLIPELSAHSAEGRSIRPDGTLRDANSLPRGYWEAKDPDDDLAAAAAAKTERGYPLTNTIFENSRDALLYQDGREMLRADLTDKQQLADLLQRFYAHVEPDIHEFEQAVESFKERVPELARGLVDKIEEAHQSNRRFQQSFKEFFALCRESLNPNLAREAVDEMLVQHLLTERLIRTIFDNADFTRRNVIAAEVEKVIDALVSQSFNRKEYLASLDRFYLAIESAARTLTHFSDKQHFLNTVYERFFQGYCVKTADTHGIVYTPQPIVDFMCASVEEVLKSEFGKSLGDPDVTVLDPCTGTGSFVVNLLRRAPKRKLEEFYRQRLFANEVMLMPYYIAALNIEHAYYELAGRYEPFEGLCFVDTLSLAEKERDLLAFSERNTERVERQTAAPITVILGNPPYNVGQLNENDNNKNRKYPAVEKRIKDTYAHDSKATNKNALSDAYVKFFRWATDRLESRDGIVCFVSNNGFLNGVAFDGFRKHLLKDFDSIYHFDFKGNARTSGERRRREGGNIFHDMIRCGVGISVLIRKRMTNDKQLSFHSVEDYWRAEEKENYLIEHGSINKIDWQKLHPDNEHTWLIPEDQEVFRKFISIGSKETKADKREDVETIFKVFSGGVKTNRDVIVYDFAKKKLEKRVHQFIEDYNSEVDRWKRTPQSEQDRIGVDNFVKYENISWSRDLKLDLQRGHYAEFSPNKIRFSLYRPFTKRHLFFDRIFNEEIYSLLHIYPISTKEDSNLIIHTTNHSQMAFSHLISACTPNEAVGGRPGKCFPFYSYDEDGSNRRENITDWALEQFREHYGKQGRKIEKWDIFYYVYGVLHHPGYLERFADCLKRELPRIPFAPNFQAFSQAGRELAELHLNYESLKPYELQWNETPGKPLSYRVEKLRLSKDKSALKVNDTLTLGGIPPETFEYRLGNRSALEWVIDQYQVKTDKRTGIVSDPNRADDPQYIVRLIGQVVRVSLETVRIVKALPERYC
ncbi:N-6 DNA methylase [Candidatus Sumerlaeota bacterium]|nr:N-6 DNA methylase [Candidatus Sumerlaeota bacterium]